MQFLLPGLGILFIALKLTAVIDWSWWLVLIPLYPAIIVWGILFGGALIALLLYIAVWIEAFVRSLRR